MQNIGHNHYQHSQTIQIRERGAGALTISNLATREWQESAGRAPFGVSKIEKYFFTV